MREILFKGKNSETGKWIEGNLIESNNGDAHILVKNSTPIKKEVSRIGYWYIDSPCYQVHPNTVCQFVKDDLFEGDILRSVNHYEKGKPYYNYHIIQWNERLCGWFAKNKDNLGKEDTNGDIQLWVYLKNTEFEKTGNIHDETT